MQHRDDEAGSATVWALVWVLLIAWLGQIGILVVGVVARQHDVDAAADLAALSAAGRLQRGGDACDAARQVAGARQVQIVRCLVIEGADVHLDVRAAVALPLGLSVELRSAARAGP